MTIWLLVMWGAAEVSFAPTQFATREDCMAVLAQVPKSEASGKCIEAKVHAP